MMNVRSRIASFEAQNEEERLRSSPQRAGTPTKVSNSRLPTSRSPSNSPVTRTWGASSASFVENNKNMARSESTFSKRISNSGVNTNSTETIATETARIASDASSAPSNGINSSPERPPSTTLVASKSRRDRLKRNGSFGSSSKNSGKTTQKETLPPNISRKNSIQHPGRTQQLHAPQPHDSPLPDPIARQMNERQQQSPVITTTRASSKATAMAKRHRAIAHKSPATSKTESVAENSLNTNDKTSIMQPDLSHDDSSDPDRPLVPRHNTKSAVTVATPIRKSRLDKIHKIQNSRRKQLNAASKSPPRNTQQEELIPPPQTSPRDDDEKTLTSVRQIVDATVGQNNGSTSPCSFVDDDDDDDDGPARLWVRPDEGNRSGNIFATSSGTKNSSGSDVKNTMNNGPLFGNSANSSNHVTEQRQKQMVISQSYSSETDEGPFLGSSLMLQQNPTKSGISGLTPDVGTIFHNASPPQPPFAPRPTQYSSQFYNSRSSLPSSKYDDEDDDGDDDSSTTSLPYEQRRRREQEARELQVRKQAVAAAQAEMMGAGPLLQKEDVEHYRKTLETPTAKTAFVVGAAATVGITLLGGPVGLVVGLSVGALSVGAMQIPPEQRENMIKSAQETVIQAGDAISHTCANTYKDSGIADHVPADVDKCCTGLVDGEDKDVMSVLSGGPEIIVQEEKKDGDKVLATSSVVHPRVVNTEGPTTVETTRNPPSPTGLARLRNKKGRVACLRENQIIPVGQIHALNPADQPRAWLEVLASVNTSHDEKMEAMQEINILAKDKQRARILVEEGILDSLMWTLGRYFEKENVADRPEIVWAHKEISRDEREEAKLAATCCLTLGKAYCAAIHTEGNLQLMSLYERGSVPEERQLAQMLHEVPYYVRVTKTEDPSIIEPRNEVFTLHQIALPQAEELANAINTLSEKR